MHETAPAGAPAWRCPMSRAAWRHDEVRRRGIRGQAMTEFALVIPLFLAVIWGGVNGGLVLFSHAQAEHAADLGMLALAAEGNYDNSSDPAPNNADTVALSRMAAAGLSKNGLITITEYDIIREVQQSDGSLVDDPIAQDRYGAGGNALQRSWPPAARNVSSGQNDYAKLKIAYRYAFVGNALAPVSLTAVKTFRLEPQT